MARRPPSGLGGVPATAPAPMYHEAAGVVGHVEALVERGDGQRPRRPSRGHVRRRGLRRGCRRRCRRPRWSPARSRPAPGRAGGRPRPRRWHRRRPPRPPPPPRPPIQPMRHRSRSQHLAARVPGWRPSRTPHRSAARRAHGRQGTGAPGRGPRSALLRLRQLLARNTTPSPAAAPVPPAKASRWGRSRPEVRRVVAGGRPDHRWSNVDHGVRNQRLTLTLEQHARPRRRRYPPAARPSARRPRSMASSHSTARAALRSAT